VLVPVLPVLTLLPGLPGVLATAVAAGAAAAAVALALPHRRTVPRLSGLSGLSGARADVVDGRTAGQHERTGSRDPAGAAARPREDSRALRWTATGCVALGTLFFVGGVAGAVAGLVAALVCWWLTGRLEPPSHRRRRERLVASVPHAVDLMAACLAVGLSPAAALEQVAAVVDAPLSEELAALTSRLRLGADPATVWRDLARHPQLGGLGRTVSRAVDSGASVADAMQRLAGDLRLRSRAAAESRARAVGVRAAVPLGACLLPAFVLVGVVPLVAGSVSVLVQR
jgi:Flp pilus assembly protein TadB